MSAATLALPARPPPARLRRRRLRFARVVAFVFAISYMSSAFLGVTSAVAVPGILGCGLLSVVLLRAEPRVYPVTAIALALVLYALLSGLMFGGLFSVFSEGLIEWLAGEGRFFLYYWPFIFVTLAMRRNPEETARRIERAMTPVTLAAFAAVLATQMFGLRLFSSHHAAGSVLYGLIIFHLFRVQYGPPRWSSLALLAISLLGLLGTGSRTGLLAAVVGIALHQLFLLRLRTTLPALLAVPLLYLVMSAHFPQQFDRLERTFEADLGRVVSTNFRIAWQADPPLESARVKPLYEIADVSVQANLAIRGILWARGLSEGLKSPLIGAGFGRFNDLGREFATLRSLYAIAVDADMANPSNHGSHNGFIMIFAELGLAGLLMVCALLWIPARGFLQTLQDPCRTREARMWAHIGIAAVIAMLLISLTQEAFNAPIFGLTIFPLIGAAHGRIKASRSAQLFARDGRR